MWNFQHPPKCTPLELIDALMSMLDIIIWVQYGWMSCYILIWFINLHVHTSCLWTRNNCLGLERSQWMRFKQTVLVSLQWVCVDVDCNITTDIPGTIKSISLSVSWSFLYPECTGQRIWWGLLPSPDWKIIITAMHSQLFNWIGTQEMF